MRHKTTETVALTLFGCIVVLVIVGLTKFIGQRPNPETDLYYKPKAEMPLGIIHKGDRFPAWAAKTTGDVVAGMDLAGFLIDGHVVLKPLSRINPPCGYPDPLDPSPENHYYPCPYFIGLGQGHEGSFDGLGALIDINNTYDMDYGNGW